MRFLPLMLLFACSAEPTDPDEEALDLEGRTYLLATGGLTVPGAEDGMNDLMKLFFTRDTLINLHSTSETAADLRLTFGEVGSDPLVQDPCSLTVDFGTASLDGHDLEFGPSDVNLLGTEVEDLYMTATLSNTGSQLREMVIQAFVDLRQAEALGFGNASDLCDTIGDFGPQCEACTDSSPTCLDLTIEGLVANYQEGVTVDPVSSVPDTCE